MRFNFLRRLLYLVITISFFIYNIKPSFSVETISIKNGVLDLSKWDFEKDGFVELKGFWEFYPDSLLDSKQIKEFNHSILKSKFNIINYSYLPSTWDNTIKNDKSFGVATYRIKVIISKPLDLLALEIPDFYSSYNLFVNGKLLSKNGIVSTSPEKFYPEWRSFTKPINLVNKETEIILQIANFSHIRGGAYKTITLGTAKELLKKRELEITFVLLLTGGLIMGGLFFIGLYFFGKKELEFLYFALFCIIYSYRIIGCDLYFLHTLFPTLSWYFTIKLEYLSLFLCTFMFSKFTLSLYPFDSSKKILLPFQYICLFLSTLTILFPAYIFTQATIPFIFIVQITIIYISYVFVMAFFRKRIGASFGFISVFAICFIGSMNILSYLGYMDENFFIYFIGYIVFFSSQYLILSYRFAISFKNSMKDAEAGLKARELFLASVSHEIRTPMNGVIGMTELLEQTNLTKEQLEYVKTIKSSGNNLLKLINDILDYSKLESGHIILENVEFSLNEVAEELAKIFYPMLKSQNNSFLVEIDNDINNKLIGDILKIKQVLINLINNANKFTENGLIRLKVIKKHDFGEIISLEFQVIDNGIGIPTNKLDTLFKAFSQVHNNDSYQGTGLGLLISRNLVEAMGGIIEVKSEEKVSTIFSFTLNLTKTTSVIKDIDESTFEPNKKENIFQSYKIDFTKEEKINNGFNKLEKYESEINNIVNKKSSAKHKILLVDDNEVNIKVAQSMLNKLSFESDTAENGLEAYNKFKLNNYDLIFMDLDMPIMNGFEATKKIISDAYKKPVIIAMTANAMQSDKDKCLEIGMNDYLSKPFKINDLEILIKKWLL